MSYKLVNFGKGKRSVRISRTNVGNRILAITIAALMMIGTIAAAFLDYNEDLTNQEVVTDNYDSQNEYPYDFTYDTEAPSDVDESDYEAYEEAYEDEYDYEGDYNVAGEIEVDCYDEYIDIVALSTVVVSDAAAFADAMNSATVTRIEVDSDIDLGAVTAPTVSGAGRNVTLAAYDNGSYTITRPYTYGGRHFTVAAGATLTLEDGITLCGDINRIADGGNIGGGVQVSGTFIMNGGTIRYNRAVNGGGVDVTNGEFTMNDGTIENNRANSGGGVRAHGSGSVIVINNGNIVNNVSASSGGGLWIYGSFTMNDGAINNNTATTGGGGIYFGINGTSFTMIGGEMRSNIAQGFQGGAMHLDARGELGAPIEIYIGGTAYIYDNRAEGGNPNWGRGGAIHVGRYHQNLTISGTAAIVGNFADHSGGGIDFASRYGTFTMAGGSISDNEAARHMGGGVRLWHVGSGVTYLLEFTMTGGEIYNNNAPAFNNGNGGGIYVGPNTEVAITDGVIRGNTAGNSGGGMFVDSTGYPVDAVTIIGTTISGNHAGTINADNGVRDNGGGILLRDRAMEIDDSTIQNNSAVEYGGGIWTYRYDNLTVSDTVIFGGNTANAPHDHGIANRGIPGYVLAANSGGAQGGNPENIVWATSTLSIPDTHALNNYDINYTGTNIEKLPEVRHIRIYYYLRDSDDTLNRDMVHNPIGRSYFEHIDNLFDTANSVLDRNVFYVTDEYYFEGWLVRLGGVPSQNYIGGIDTDDLFISFLVPAPTGWTGSGTFMDELDAILVGDVIELIAIWALDEGVEPPPQPTPQPTPQPPGAGNQGQGGIPATGIESNIVLWSILLAVTLFTATGAVVWIANTRKKLVTKNNCD